MNAIRLQEGLKIDYTPSAAVDAGAIVDLGALLGVAERAIAAAALGALAVEGVFRIVKSGSTGPVFVVGDAVYWDTVNSLAVRTGGSGCRYLGTAVAAAGASTAYVDVQLGPHALPAAMQDKLWEDVDISGGSKTLDIQDVGKVLNVTVGHATNVVTLPATAAGLDFIVRCGATGQRVALSPQAADKIMGADLAGADNKDRILAAATSRIGDYCRVRAEGTDGYLVDCQRGIWTAES